MDWWLVAEGLLVAALVVLLACLPLMWLRRRWLSSQGGLFDCALQVREGAWALGMARYRGDNLEWYRVFSVSFRPRVTFNRRETTWQARRTPSAEESTLLFTDHEVVTLRGVDRGGQPRPWQLAMGPASATGLMSWLEASAPGRGVGYGDEG